MTGEDTFHFFTFASIYLQISTCGHAGVVCGFAGLSVQSLDRRGGFPREDSFHMCVPFELRSTEESHNECANYYYKRLRFSTTSGPAEDIPYFWEIARDSRRLRLRKRDRKAQIGECNHCSHPSLRHGVRSAKAALDDFHITVSFLSYACQTGQAASGLCDWRWLEIGWKSLLM